MWEDEANKFGGKWIVRLRKGDIHPREADRHFPWQVSVLGAGRTWYWPCSVSSSWWGRRSAALLSLSGSRRTYWGEAVWKVIHSVSFSPNIFCSIWNRTACDQAVTNRIRDTFRRVLIFHVISYFWIDGFCLFTADLAQVLSLPTGTAIEYKAHNDSLKWVWFCSDLGILFAKARGVWNSWVAFELSFLKTSVQLRIVLMGLFVGNIQGLEQNQSSGETW